MSDTLNSCVATGRIKCDGCRLCMNDCPLDLKIPELIKLYNKYLVHKTKANLKHEYECLTVDTAKTSDCAGCRVCEGFCRENVKIYEVVRTIAALFD